MHDYSQTPETLENLAFYRHMMLAVALEVPMLTFLNSIHVRPSEVPNDAWLSLADKDASFIARQVVFSADDAVAHNEFEFFLVAVFCSVYCALTFFG